MRIYLDFLFYLYSIYFSISSCRGEKERERKREGKREEECRSAVQAPLEVGRFACSHASSDNGRAALSSVLASDGRTITRRQAASIRQFQQASVL